MTLRQQLLQELRTRDEEAKAAIAKLKEEIEAEYFMKSTITDGAFSATARNACDNRAQIATNRKSIGRKKQMGQRDAVPIRRNGASGDDDHRNCCAEPRHYCPGGLKRTRQGSQYFGARGHRLVSDRSAAGRRLRLLRAGVSHAGSLCRGDLLLRREGAL